MALGPLLDGFFTDEWNRLQSGLAKLSPEQQRLYLAQTHQRGLMPGETATVSIPGWDEVIHLAPRYSPTPAERSEYYAARREQRPANLSQDALTSMQYQQLVRDRIRTSAQPEYAKAFGEILTAVDNVQDFFSTVSTLGRLGVWGATAGLNWWAPGATVEAATIAGQAAAATARAEAVAAFDAALLRGALAGESIAGRLLENEALQVGARAATAAAAEKAAYTLAFRTALLGLGARVALRLLPWVGWVLLAADLLNLLNLLGLTAMPAYALLCSGPSEALAAGVPAVVFKRILKSETWKNHQLNPFSRNATARRAAKAARGIPGFGALLEVAQTTDQLFGRGISLGGLVGVLTESSFAFSRASRGEHTSLDTTGLRFSFTGASAVPPRPGGDSLDAIGREMNRMLDQRLGVMSQVDLIRLQQASRVLATSPAILSQQDIFDDETHLKAMVAYAAAISTLAPVLKGTGWQELWPRLGSVAIPTVGQPSPETREWACESGLDIEASRGWWFADGRQTVSATEYALHFAETVPAATRRFLEPRRNTVAGAFYGALVNQIAEATWLMLEEDDELFRWELTTDARLVSSLVEAGRLVNVAAGEEKIWKFWTDARGLLEQNSATSLQADMWDYLAKRNDVPLIKLLPPGSPWPQEWYDWMMAQPGATRKATGFAEDLNRPPS